MKKEKKQLLKLAAQITGDILFLVILFIALGILIPTTMGYRVFEIKSDSMAEDYPRHALIYVKEVDQADELKKGDVICFDRGAQNSEVLTQRIVKVDETKQAFQTKGDANDTPDTEPVSYSNVIGKVVFCVPKIGGIVSALQGISGVFLVLLLLLLGVSCFGVSAVLSKEEKPKKKAPNISGYFVIGLCFVLFSGYHIGKILIQYQQGKEAYTKISQTYTQKKTEKDSAKETKEQMSWKTRTIDFEGLRKINPDIVGWLSFDKGEIDYPILQASDDKKYLRTTFEGKENPCGSIFLEAENASNFSDSYSLIYGHNMKNGTMFGSLKQYKLEEEYWKTHTYFTIYTPTQIRHYAIFYFADVSQESEIYTIGFQNSALFEDFLQKRRQESYVDTGVKATRDDKVVALSTCSSEKKRFVVMGKLQEKIIR